MCILNGLKIGTSFLQEMNGRIVWSRNPTRGVLTTKRPPEAWRARCGTRVPRPADITRGDPYICGDKKGWAADCAEIKKPTVISKYRVPQIKVTPLPKSPY